MNNTIDPHTGAVVFDGSKPSDRAWVITGRKRMRMRDVVRALRAAVEMPGDDRTNAAAWPRLKAWAGTGESR